MDGAPVAAALPVRPGRRVREWIRTAAMFGDLWPTVAGVVVVAGVLGGFWAFAASASPTVWVPVLVLVGLLAASIPICLRLAGRPADRRLRKLLLLGLFLKMAFVFPRFVVNEVVYAGENDAGQYHQAGETFYDNVHHGRWSIDGSEVASFPQETRIVGYLTGILFLAVGTTYMGGYLVFTWVSWIGTVFVFKAFRVAYPNAPPHRAALLIFFLPSLLYWPSSIGKDAVMVLCIGLLTLGVSRLLTGSGVVRGVICTVVGGQLVLLVRPHLVAIALVGVAASTLARRANTPSSRSTRALVVRGALLVLLVPTLFLVLGRLDQAFGTDGGGPVSVATLDRTESQTSIGGSSFDARPVRSPVDLPVALLSVIYRPFLFEATSVPVLISALEGTGLLVLTVLSGRWLWRVGPAMYHHPFAAFCGAYVVAFVIAFSNIGNAGILARQRVQMFPILMLLVAAAAEEHRSALGGEVPPVVGRSPALIPFGSVPRAQAPLPGRTARAALTTVGSS